MFEPAGIALTSEAREIKNTTGSDYTTKLFGFEVSELESVGYKATLLALSVGGATYLYGKFVMAKTYALKWEDQYFELVSNYTKDVKTVAEKLRTYYSNNGYNRVAFGNATYDLSAMDSKLLCEHLYNQLDPTSKSTKLHVKGDPITADIVAQKGSNSMPVDKGTGIRMFGKTDMVNIVSEEYCYNDKLGGLYIFSGTEKSGNPGKIEPTSSTADSSSAVGALIAFFIFRKKKGDNITA